MSQSSSASEVDQQNAYLSFTRKLAHSEKKVRDRAVRFVAKWLAHQPKASETDLRKLWQGLFFCLWHADKLIVQAEVATNIAGLMHSAGTVEAGMRYLGAGLWTIQQRWQTVDKYRVDKFLSLLRHLLRQALLLLARHQWRPDDIALFAQPMQRFALGRDSTGDLKALPLCPGIALHFADIFIDELKLAVETGADGHGKLKLRKDAMNDVLEPFLRALSQYPDKLVITRLDERVMQPILRGPTTVATDEELPAASPLRFFDYPALAARFFTYATSKDTKESHRARFYGYRKTLQKHLNVSTVTHMDITTEVPQEQHANGVARHETNGKTEHEHEQEENGAEENGGETEAGMEEEEAAQPSVEEEEVEDEEQTVSTKKRKHAHTSACAGRVPQRSWIDIYRKRTRLSRNSLLGLPQQPETDEPETNGTAEEEVIKRKPTGPRLRFSLESNSVQEFRKVDPPAKHARGSTPPPNRKPAFGILKSPLKNAHSPVVRK